MPGKKEMGLGDLGGVMPPAKPTKKRRGVAIDLEKNPIPKPQSNLDEVNQELQERFGDLASPPENMYIKDTPEEIAARNARTAAEMEVAMANYNQLKQQGAAEEAAATGQDPLESMMNNIPKAETIPEAVPAAPEAPPKPRKVEVVQGVNPGVDVNAGGFKAIDPSKLMPHVPTEQEADEAAQKIWDDLDKAVDRTKREMSADQEKLFEKMREEQEELQAQAAEAAAAGDVPAEDHSDDGDGSDLADDAYTNVGKSADTEQSLKDRGTDDFDDFEDDLDDMLNDDDPTPSPEEDEEDPEERNARIERTRKEIVAEIDAKISPIKNKIDISGFTVAKKPISALKVLKRAEEQNGKKQADWVLFRAKRRITMSALSGAEIINLNPANSSQNRFNTIKTMYQILYRHVIDANKPSFEAWLKTIYLEDVPHLYFCAFRATFGDSNYMPATCLQPKCQSAFLNDIEDTENLVVYDSDETKDELHRILEGDTTTEEKFEAIPAEIYQISDDYVVGLRRLTIYGTLMETAALPEKFIEKYSDMIDVISYIDGIYLIDHKSKQLIPIEVKEDPKSATKSAAYKIRTYHDILRHVSPDIYSNLYGYILKNYQDEDKIKFRVPSATCSKCGATIPAEDMTAQQLLFTRHQLAAYGNI